MGHCGACGAMAHPTDAYCRSCGSALAPAPPPPPSGYHPATGWQPPQDLGRPIEQSTAIVALVLNIIVWPGLGSIIGGENVGWVQGFLNLFGLLLVFTIIGIVIGVPLMIGMWIWGIVTGVQLLNRAQAQQQARLAAMGPR